MTRMTSAAILLLTLALPASAEPASTVTIYENGRTVRILRRDGDQTKVYERGRLVETHRHDGDRTDVYENGRKVRTLVRER